MIRLAVIFQVALVLSAQTAPKGGIVEVDPHLADAVQSREQIEAASSREAAPFEKRLAQLRRMPVSADRDIAILVAAGQIDLINKRSYEDLARFYRNLGADFEKQFATFLQHMSDLDADLARQETNLARVLAQAEQARRACQQQSSMQPCNAPSEAVIAELHKTMDDIRRRVIELDPQRQAELQSLKEWKMAAEGKAIKMDAYSQVAGMSATVNLNEVEVHVIDKQMRLNEPVIQKLLEDPTSVKHYLLTPKTAAGAPAGNVAGDAQ